MYTWVACGMERIKCFSSSLLSPSHFFARCFSSIRRGSWSKSIGSASVELHREKGTKRTRRSRAFNDNEGSMRNFSANLIIDMCGRVRRLRDGYGSRYLFAVEACSHAGRMSIINFKYWDILNLMAAEWLRWRSRFYATIAGLVGTSRQST